jgi:hypothetical protein
MWAELEQHTDQEMVGTIKWMNRALFSIKANADDNPMWNKKVMG